MTSVAPGWSSLRAYPWIVCKSCGDDIGEASTEYVNLRRDGRSHAEALEELEISNLCCVMDIMRPGLIPQPPTKEDHEQQKALLNNLKERRVRFGALSGSLNPLTGLSQEAVRAIDEVGEDADAAFDDLIAGIIDEPLPALGADAGNVLLLSGGILDSQSRLESPSASLDISSDREEKASNGPRAVALKGKAKRRGLSRMRVKK